MNQMPSQLRLTFNRSQALISRISRFARCWPVPIATVAMSLFHSGRILFIADGRGRPLPAALPMRLAIDALQLPLGNRDGTLDVLAASAVVGEHVDHQEVGDGS